MIASILVDVKAREVDKTFDYNVPSYLEEVIEIGQRVKVPFGPRLIMGYVLGFKETSDFDRLKNVVQVLDLVPSLTKELLELGKTLAMSNTSPLVSIYQAMLPKALKSKYKKKLVCEDTSLLDLDLALKFNKNSEVIYDDLLKSYFKEIKNQINLGNIVVKYEVKQANNEKYISKIKLIDENNPLRGIKQKAVVKYLLTNNDCLKSVLLKELKISSTTLKSLIEKGVIVEYKVETYREIDSIYGINKKTVVLNKEQVSVYNSIKEKLSTNEIFLLHGITGSGKTEIYLNIIEEVLNSGLEAIMLVPEISLTPMMVSRFKGRFGNDVAMLHSGLSIGEKYDEWRKIRRKEVKVVVGARSAIFAPFTNLGIIIIDEEHTDSYKQIESPNYHALDVAILRAKYYNVPLVLGSATPSVESYYKAKNNEYTLLEINNRANKTTLPIVYIEDMRYEFKGGKDRKSVV